MSSAAKLDLCLHIKIKPYDMCSERRDAILKQCRNKSKCNLAQLLSSSVTSSTGAHLYLRVTGTSAIGVDHSGRRMGVLWTMPVHYNIQLPKDSIA